MQVLDRGRSRLRQPTVLPFSASEGASPGNLHCGLSGERQFNSHSACRLNDLTRDLSYCHLLYRSLY